MEPKGRSRIFAIFPEFFRKYGLAFVMVASYFGSGSIFIASSAGVQYGYALLWAVLAAALLGFMAQDMSGRLGIFGEPLMAFTRRKLGRKGALAVALWLSVGCIAWTLGLTAAVGAGVSALLGGAVSWQPIAVGTGITAIVVGIRGYASVEHIMTAMLVGLMVIYLVVAGASAPDPVAILAGLVPGAAELSTTVGATLIAGILGTTALWPNFFLESILVREKGWHSRSDVQDMRKDLVVGYTIGGVITAAILIVSAAVLRPQGITQLDSFLTPGFALAEVLGAWAMVLFIIGAIGAAFNSIIPIMWTPAYLIPQALGYDVSTVDPLFKKIYIGGIAIGSLSPLLHEVLGLTVLEMVILFPTFNGIFGLPIAAILLFWAVNDRATMGEERNDLKKNAINLLLVLLSVVLALLSVRGFLSAITVHLS